MVKAAFVKVRKDKVVEVAVEGRRPSDLQAVPKSKASPRTVPLPDFLIE